MRGCTPAGKGLGSARFSIPRTLMLRMQCISYNSAMLRRSHPTLFSQKVANFGQGLVYALEASKRQLIFRLTINNVADFKGQVWIQLARKRGEFPVFSIFT